MNWELRALTLRSAGIGQPMRFKAELTNPKPPGLIHTSGKFGPWNVDEPSETRLQVTTISERRPFDLQRNIRDPVVGR